MGTPIQQQCFSHDTVESKIVLPGQSPKPGAFDDPLDGRLHTLGTEGGIGKRFSQKCPQFVEVCKATEEVGDCQHLLTTHGSTWIAFCKGNGCPAQDLKPLLRCPVPERSSPPVHFDE